MILFVRASPALCAGPCVPKSFSTTDLERTEKCERRDFKVTALTPHTRKGYKPCGNTKGDGWLFRNDNPKDRNSHGFLRELSVPPVTAPEMFVVNSVQSKCVLPRRLRMEEPVWRFGCIPKPSPRTPFRRPLMTARSLAHIWLSCPGTRVILADSSR